MGIIKRGILGGFSGKVANVVGSSWKGIAVMRALPLSVNNPRTAGQVKQRSAFSVTSKLASSILTQWVKPLWDRTAQQMSGYNAFIQRNVDIVKADKELDIENIIFSQGKLGDNSNVRLQQNDGDYQLSWNPAPQGAFQMESDKVYVVLFDAEGNYIGGSEGVETRSIGSIDVSDLLNNSSDVIRYAVLAFSRVDGTMVSNSTVVKI